MFNVETTVRHLQFSPAHAAGGSGEAVQTPTDHGIRVPGGAELPDTLDVWSGLGGNNLYSNAANWKLGVVPNNGAIYNGQATTFTAEIDNSSAVTLDINPTIDSLTIDATSSLSIEPGRTCSLTVDVVHQGTIDGSTTGAAALSQTHCLRGHVT